MKQALLRWYRRHRRWLSWRENVSPYRTWVSEIMLQQTTVATVIPYYERFLRRFPDVDVLAEASEQEVLRAWAGLGYYSRARNLREAARKIVAEHGGVFPGEYEKVLDLPGIGRYTAGAILSIAFDKPYPVLDGNVMRVFSRICGIRRDIKRPETAKRMWGLAEKLVPKENPGDWNQALMELGATVCLPEAPDCGSCPVSRDCVAFKKGLQKKLPVTGQRPDWVDLKWTCLWVRRNGQVLLWKRSDNERFLKRHWGLPEARHLRAEPGPRLKLVRHTITNHRIALEIREAKLGGRLPKEARWVPRARLKDYLVSSLWLKSLPDRA